MTDQAVEPRLMGTPGAPADSATEAEPAEPAIYDRPWFVHYEAGVPHEIEIPDEPLDWLLRRAAKRHPDRVATDFLGARVRFGQLDDAVDRFARWLQSHGLQPGDRVSIHLPNCPAFLIALLGTVRAGGIAVPISPILVQREVEALLRETTPRFSVSLDLVVPRVAAARAALAGVLDPGPIVVTGIRDWLPAPIRWLYPIKARREGRWHPVADSGATPHLGRILRETPGGEVASVASPDQPAVLQPTGGTTGIPKAAVLTHRNLVANTIQTAAWFPGTDDNPGATLAVVPYCHVYGLTVALCFSLLIGATQVLHPRFDPKAVLKSIGRTKPSTFPGAPTLYATLADHPDRSRYDLRSIDACISGSAPLPPDVQSRFESATGGRVCEGYGLTEASPVTHCNPIRGERRMGTVGLPFPSTDARVVDLETGERALGPGEAGQLAVRGPQVMAGYWHRPDETAAVMRGDWLLTGDMATVDEDGYFRIVDRLKDMIIVGGRNVYPREVEEVLASHPAVAEAAVVAQPDAILGEVPRAYVVLLAGAAATPAELVAWCQRDLARFKVPVAVEVRSELPRTYMGKLQRRALVREREEAAR